MFLISLVVLTTWKGIWLVVLIVWKGIDAQAIILDLDALVVPAAGWSSFIYTL